MKKHIPFYISFFFASSLVAQTTVNFGYTGAAQSWIVPPCVYSIDVDVRGAEGGGPQGGNGARVTATFAVTPGDILQVNVGGSGASAGTGWNGGGTGWAGSTSSFGGGGASDIRIAPYALANRLIVGAGGGGHSGGTGYTVGGGAGGCATGVNGPGSIWTGTGGTGGTQVAGGNGGPFYPGGQMGQNGALGLGGNGGFWGTASGGGGGGGFYGGGGGGSDGCCTGANGGGGGGGGSSFTPAGGVCTANSNNGAGTIAITYSGGSPVLVAANTGPYCEGSTIQLSSTAGGIGYSWTGPNGFASNAQNPSIPSSTTGMSGMYIIELTALGGCITIDTTVVTINPVPTPTATNTGPYCVGNTIQLNSPAGSATDDWAGPGYAVNNMLNPTISLGAVAMSGTYTVTVTNGFNCSATATTNVVVNALPVPTASNTGPYCEGEVVDISSTGGTDYDWTGPGAFVLNNTQNTSFPSAAMAMNGTYTVTVTDANNCSATATTAMVVNLLPIPTANNTGPYCEGDAINLTSSGGAGYAWAGPVAYVSIAQNPVINPSTVAMNGTYSVVVSTAAGCTATATTTIVVTALPIPIASNTGPYCEGQKVDLSSTVGTVHAWSGPLSFSSSAQNPFINNAIPGNSGTYTVTITDGANCSSSTTTVVTVHPTPTAVPFYSPSNPTTLNPEVNFFDESYPNITIWEWEIDSTIYNTSTFTHTFSTAGTFGGLLTVTNQWGCFDTTLFTVIVKPEITIFIPNSFTPNDDGLNEIFFVQGVNWEKIEVMIYDRWGMEVFHSDDPSKGWNGRMNNMGELLIQGTYAYRVLIVDYYGKSHTMMGHVNLIR